jgi:succinate dehydrogenase hydrophobic anchor subunit
MWLLTVRRAHSHDPYDLFKPPFVAFMLLLVFLVVMFFSGANLTVNIETPIAGNGAYSYLDIGLTTILLFSLVLSFVGVVIAESASRIRKRLTL